MRMILIGLLMIPFVIVWVLGGLVSAGMALEKISVGLAFAWVPVWLVLSVLLLARVFPALVENAIDGDLEDDRQIERDRRAEENARWTAEAHARATRAVEPLLELQIARMRARFPE